MSTTTSVTGTSTTGAATTATAAGRRTLSQQDFMNLFIKQLQNQDPLKPMDSFQMAEQMAMFSNVEALNNMNTTLTDLLAYQTSQNNLQLLGLMDKTVQAPGDKIAVNNGATRKTDFTLQGGADTCVIEIYDAAGSFVRSINLGAKPAGTYQVEWDGKDSLGKTMPDGVYQYKVEAKDHEGTLVPMVTNITGEVTGLDYTTGKALLSVDGFIPVDVSSISRVM